MAGEERGYISYLLRLWQVKNKGQLIWRGSLESSQTGEHWGFASLTELFTFLDEETEAGQIDAQKPEMDEGE